MSPVSCRVSIFAAIVVDQPRWLHPGDILHEAGHLAVTAPEARSAERRSPNPGDEMAAIAWSYAAAVGLDLPTAIVCHAAGYRNDAQALIENFEAGHYFGVPLLQWYGMTIEPRQAKPGGPPPYPHMRWAGSADRPPTPSLRDRGAIPIIGLPDALG